MRELIERTPHQADLIKIPAREDSLLNVVAGYEAFSRLDLGHFDLVVTTKSPAWIVRHPNHTVYLFHPIRALYDLYPLWGLPERVDYDAPDLRSLQTLVRQPPDRGLLDDFFPRFWELVAERGPGDPAFHFPGPLAREIVRFLDRISLDPRYVSRHVALSRTVARRRDYFPPGVPVEVLYLPPFLERFACRRFDYLFTPSRIEGNKRVDLLVRAMRHVAGDVRLKIAGIGPELPSVRAAAGDDARIEFLGPLSDSELVETYADALAVPVVPHDEELGLVTIEAMLSGKPVITCTDSGGPTEFVEDGVNGFVVAPTPEAVGAALTRLAVEPALAARLGAAGRRRVEGITWRRTVQELVRAPRATATPARRSGLRRLVVAASGRVHPPRSRAQLRALLLARALASDADVEIVSVGAGETRSQRVVAPGVSETVVPSENVTAAASGGEYAAALGHASRGAAALLLTDAALHPAVAALGARVPVVYDTDHLVCVGGRENAEAEDGRARPQRTFVRAAVRDAALVLATSEEDAELLARRYGADGSRFLAAPALVDAAAIRPVRGSERAETRRRWLERFLEPLADPPDVDRLALFLGSAHAGNVDAARRIVGLARHLPRVLFVVAGACCESARSPALPGNVVLAGVVSDTEKSALLRSADVALNPVRLGRGPSAKVVEYLAGGVPVVSTPLGVRGLGVEDGVHAVLSQLRAFAASVRRVLDDERLAATVAERGRALVEEHYDWKVLAPRLREGIAPLLEGRSREAVGGATGQRR